MTVAMFNKMCTNFLFVIYSQFKICYPLSYRADSLQTLLNMMYYGLERVLYICHHNENQTWVWNDKKYLVSVITSVK